MQSKLWVFREYDPTHRAALAQALSISSATASLLLARGVTTPLEAASWMCHQVPHDPFLIPDMEVAVERLYQAVCDHEAVCFYGDYDVDGMSATALYMSFFGSLGANVRGYVPHRKREGYGLNAAAVQRLHDEGVSLLVTSDCGTTSLREIGLAKQLGMDVIVTDHHQTGEDMPPAVASAALPAPQKVSKRLAPLIAPPVSCATQMPDASGRSRVRKTGAPSGTNLGSAATVVWVRPRH